MNHSASATSYVFLYFILFLTQNSPQKWFLQLYELYEFKLNLLTFASKRTAVHFIAFEVRGTNVFLRPKPNGVWICGMKCMCEPELISEKQCWECKSVPKDTQRHTQTHPSQGKTVAFFGVRRANGQRHSMHWTWRSIVFNEPEGVEYFLRGLFPRNASNFGPIHIWQKWAKKLETLINFEGDFVQRIDRFYQRRDFSNRKWRAFCACW